MALWILFSATSNGIDPHIITSEGSASGWLLQRIIQAISH